MNNKELLRGKNSITLYAFAAYLFFTNPVLASKDDTFTSCSLNLMLASDFSFNGALNELEYKILLEEMAPRSCNIVEAYDTAPKLKDEWNTLKCLCTDVAATQAQCCSTQLQLTYEPNPPPVYAQICERLNELVQEECLEGLPPPATSTAASQSAIIAVEHSQGTTSQTNTAASESSITVIAQPQAASQVQATTTETQNIPLWASSRTESTTKSFRVPSQSKEQSEINKMSFSSSKQAGNVSDLADSAALSGSNDIPLPTTADTSSDISRGDNDENDKEESTIDTSVFIVLVAMTLVFFVLGYGVYHTKSRDIKRFSEQAKRPKTKEESKDEEEEDDDTSSFAEDIELQDIQDVYIFEDETNQYNASKKESNALQNFIEELTWPSLSKAKKVLKDILSMIPRQNHDTDADESGISVSQKEQELDDLGKCSNHTTMTTVSSCSSCTDLLPSVENRRLKKKSSTQHEVTRSSSQPRIVREIHYDPRTMSTEQYLIERSNENTE